MSNGPPGTRTSARSGGEGTAGPPPAGDSSDLQPGSSISWRVASIVSSCWCSCCTTIPYTNPPATRPPAVAPASRGSGGARPPAPWRSAHARPSRLHGRLVARGHEPGKVAVAGGRRPRIHQLVRRGPPAGDEAVVIGGAGRLHRPVYAEPWE